MWSKPDSLDRLAQALVAIAMLVALANALFMLASPFGWYEAVGTVKATGPANGHFIRDIGLAYLLCASLLGYAAVNLPMRWGAALAGSGWLAAHGGLHVYEVMRGICAPGIFWSEAPGTLGPPLLALSGITIHLVRQRIAPFPLPGRSFVKVIDRLLQRDAGYVHRIADLPGHALEKFQHFMPVTMHRRAASPELFAMARIGATMAEDCGPCTLIVARGALGDGVPRDLVNAALAGHLPAGALAEAFAFGSAVATNAPETAELGEAIARQHGQTVRDELALTVAMVRTYPALKRGLGLAQSCAVTPLKV